MHAEAELVTLAPGLRPERCFAPLARGLFKICSYRAQTTASSGLCNAVGKITKQESQGDGFHEARGPIYSGMH